ncbi:MAG: hypothetical protein U0325_06785 [Polyangiales bacterium]
MRERAEWLLARTRGLAFALCLGVAYAGFGARAVLSERYFHDEGFLSWFLASYLLHDPIPTLFFLKAKPVMGLMNLPGTALGRTGFFAQHVLLGAFGVGLAYAVARAWRIREAGFVALAIAASPLYLEGGPSGISNVDSVVATLLALWLLARPPGLALGLWLAALPLVRSELALVSLALALYAVVTAPTRARLLLGLLGLPAAYVVAGAVYHRDALWPVHYLPVYGRIPSHINLASVLGSMSAREVLLGLALTTPTLALVPLCRAAALTPRERLARTLIVGYLAALLGLPLLHLGFGFSTRYLVVLLPFAALLGARATESATLLWRRLPAPVTLAIMAALAAWPAVAPPTELSTAEPRTRAVVAWMRAHPEALRGRTVYTNDWLLDPVAHGRHGLRDVDICFIVQPDMAEELRAWTNDHNGQRERIFALLRWRFYGRSARIEQLRGAPALRGALLAELRDPRFSAASLGVPARPLWSAHGITLYELGAPGR